jgi:NIMA (never in mitosis gene a)-related kinase 1/4/5
MDEAIIWDYLRQAVEGLMSLHAMGILHRDLKCANLFLGSDDKLKIGDLNVSIVDRPSRSMAKTQTGTPYYTAPEIWKGYAYSTKSDIWSIGCIAYELCS